MQTKATKPGLARSASIEIGFPTSNLHPRSKSSLKLSTTSVLKIEMQQAIDHSVWWPVQQPLRDFKSQKGWSVDEDIVA